MVSRDLLKQSSEVKSTESKRRLQRLINLQWKKKSEYGANLYTICCNYDKQMNRKTEILTL